MAGNVYGLDLGTYEIKIYDKKKNKIWREKNAVALKDKTQFFAAGNKAYDIYEKEPADIEVVFPMQDGVIARFGDMQHLLGSLLGSGRPLIGGARYVIAVPTDVTEVEKKAFYDLVVHSEARARSVRIVERGLADAIGCGIDVMKEKGVFIVNLGGDTTELSVLSRGGMVMSRLLKTGGHDFDMAIVLLVRRKAEFLIGNTTAEMMRRTFGLSGYRGSRAIRVSGRDLITGVPSQKEIPAGLVRAAMKGTLRMYVRAVRSMLERTPPDVRKVIEDRGIFLTGGMSAMRGIDEYFRKHTGLPVTTADRPQFCAVRGLRKIISEKIYYKQLTYSMDGEKYRWLR